MAAGKLSAGVELYSGGARVAVVSPKPVPTVLYCGEVTFQTGDESRVAMMVSRLLEQADIHRADVHLVFTPPFPAPGRHSLFIAPKMKKAELQQVASRELKRDGQLDPEKAYFTIDALDAAEVVEGQTESAGTWHIITALEREAVTTAASSFLGSKLALRSATTSMMGILRACALTDMPRQGCVAICHLDPKRSALMVLDNGTPRFFRDIPTTFARGGREGADDMLVAQAVAREIDISLVFFAQQHRPKHVDSIVFVGDPEIADRVIEWLGEGQGYNITRFAPSEQLQLGPNVSANILSYGPAIGAALANPKFTADVLPTEMRGRPEQALGFIGAAALLLLVLAFVATSYRSAHARADEETARAAAKLAEFQRISTKVDQLKKLDDQFAHADRWETYFEQLNLYHRRMGNELFKLQNALPPRGSFSGFLLKDAAAIRPPPLPGKVDANKALQLDGQVIATDLQGAQSDVLLIHHNVELLPDAQFATLDPLTQPKQSDDGLHLPFTIKAGLANVFPGTPGAVR